MINRPQIQTFMLAGQRLVSSLSETVAAGFMSPSVYWPFSDTWLAGPLMAFSLIQSFPSEMFTSDDE